MAMKYQKGAVYLCGEKVKMWYGKYLIYGQHQDGKEVRKHRNVRICPKANTPKWKAEQLLREIILKETGTTVAPRTLLADDSVTFRWIVNERYIPMRQGMWSPAFRKTNTYQLKHYLVSQFGDLPLRRLDAFGIQIWLNGLAERGYSQAVVHQCFSNIRAITHTAKKQKFLVEDPGEDVTMPQTKPVERPAMMREQILALIGGVEDAQGALRHASIQTTGDVYVQTIEKSVLNAMNTRTVEILTDWEPTILSGTNATPIDPGTPKRRSLRVVKQLDQLGPSGEERQAVSY